MGTNSDTNWLRRIGLWLALVLLLSAVLVPAASAEGTVIHVVQRGETLYRIAQRYGVNMYRIAEVNGLTNLNAIYPGQRLIIPLGGPLPACPVYHRVMRGENLTRIAARYGVTVRQIQAWNRLLNPNWIYVGQVLVIYPPRCGAGGTPQPTPAPGSWLAQYYNNRDLADTPVLERREANLSHNWGYGSPAPSVFADNFSARWTRTFNMAGGTYRITVRVDDGVRVYIDGILVLDSWTVQAATTYIVDVVIAGGNRTFTVEFFEAEGVAEISLNVKKL
ncbi:MAG: LysM peptidoglycan-binding domain-containing protein [Anaerolineae bacterium]